MAVKIVNQKILLSIYFMRKEISFRRSEALGILMPLSINWQEFSRFLKITTTCLSPLESSQSDVALAQLRAHHPTKLLSELFSNL